MDFERQGKQFCLRLPETVSSILKIPPDFARMGFALITLRFERLATSGVFGVGVAVATTYFNFVFCAVVRAVAVVFTSVYRATDAVVFVIVHNSQPPLRYYYVHIF